ncbi:MAG TPA: hypothetical protein VFC89_01170 [Oscillospiraceae bacterium]|nr:hypothetical protein [Oscillospiraceae bacterium]
MEYVVIGIFIVVVIVISVVSINRKKKMTAENLLEQTNSSLITMKKAQISKQDENIDKLIIQMEMLPADLLTDEGKLVEITDSKVLARVNNLVPGLAQAGVASNNAVQAAKAGSEVLYRAIIPAGAKFANSKTMEGAVRGFYFGADGIQGHANLVAIQEQKGRVIAANAASAAMGVVSMVVGQYYMTQISAGLGVISDGISKISDFQDNEFRSRVFSLVAHIKRIAKFQVEILENDELRLSKIAQLDSLEEECTKLLGQVNLTLAGYAKKDNLDYNSYEKELKNAQNWYMYQKALMDVLYKISDLRYTLHLGAVSREQCIALLPTYTKQVSDTQKMLTRWHKISVERLNIDTGLVRRKRGGVDSIIHLLPGLFDDYFNFRSIPTNTAAMITSQSTGHEVVIHQDKSNLYAEDVQLISKGGKIYYLPESRLE